MVSQAIKSALTTRSAVRNMFEKAQEMKNNDKNTEIFDFSLGNPFFEPPVQFYEAIKQIISDKKPGKHRYMVNAGLNDVRDCIATRLSSQNNLPFTSDNILMSTGAGGGLNVVFKTILEIGNIVMTIAPYFMEYKHYVSNHSGRLLSVESDENFQPQIDKIQQAISDQTKALLLNSPNNPTGVVYSEDSIKEISQVLLAAQRKYNHNIFLISDEPYSNLIYDGRHNTSIFKHYHNSIVVTSHSKDFSLAGERIGYIAFSPLIADNDIFLQALAYCNRTLGFVNAPALMQRALVYMYKNNSPINDYTKLRETACQILSENKFQYIKPEGAFYIFPKSPIEDDIAFTNIALKNKVLVVPGSTFGRSGYFRMSYSVDKEKMIRSKPKFKKIMADCENYANIKDR